MSTFYKYTLPQKAGILSPDPDSADFIEWLEANYPNFVLTDYQSALDVQSTAVGHLIVEGLYTTETETSLLFAPKDTKIIAVIYEILLDESEDVYIYPEWKKYHDFYQQHPSWDTPGSFVKQTTT